MGVRANNERSLSKLLIDQSEENQCLNWLEVKHLKYAIDVDIQVFLVILIESNLNLSLLEPLSA